MIIRFAAAFAGALGLMVTTLGFSSPASAQSRALVCYYDKTGQQTDADSCHIGWHLSDPGALNLRARCSDEQAAICEIGSKGTCSTTAYDYSKYHVFNTNTMRRCPRRYVGGGTGGGVVTPTCPPGYILSGSSCVEKPRPAPQPTGLGKFDIRNGFDLPGGDYATLPGKVAYEACVNACRRDRRCKAFTYNIRFSKCFLKERGSRWKPWKTAISGWRQQSHQQPSSSGFGGFQAYVTGLQPNEIISIRSKPRYGRNKVGALPASAENIQVVWCDVHGGERWCQISWQGIGGWVPEQYLQNVEGGQ